MPGGWEDNAVTKHSELLFSVIRSLKLPLLGPSKPKKVRSNLAHLDLLRPFGDPIAAEMAIDVLERILPRVPITAMDLRSQYV